MNVCNYSWPVHHPPDASSCAINSLNQKSCKQKSNAASQALKLPMMMVPLDLLLCEQWSILQLLSIWRIVERKGRFHNLIVELRNNLKACLNRPTDKKGKPKNLRIRERGYETSCDPWLGQHAKELVTSKVLSHGPSANGPRGPHCLGRRRDTGSI